MSSPEALEALEFMVMVFEDGYSPEEALSWKEEDSEVRFISGETIFLSGRQSTMLRLDDPGSSNVVDMWGWIPNPAQPGGRHSGFTEYWAFAISKFSDNPEEAVRVLEQWASLPSMKNFNFAWGPIQGNRDVYSDPDVIAANPNLSLIEEVAATALAPMPTANYGEVSDILMSELHSALTGLTPPQQALENVCSGVDAISVGP
jgi:multiple sugar transport system substrate-binding protein